MRQAGNPSGAILLMADLIFPEARAPGQQLEDDFEKLLKMLIIPAAQLRRDLRWFPLDHIKTFVTG